MADKSFSLLVELKADMKEFRKGMDDAQRKNKSVTSSMKSNWKAVAVAVAAAAAALKAAKSTIEASQVSGDRFNETVAGMRLATERFQEKLITLDFNNFLQDLRDAKIAGQEFARALDTVSDYMLAVGIRRAQGRQEILDLRRIASDTSLSTDERLLAINKAQALAQKQINDEVAVRTMELDAQRDKVKALYDLTDDQVSALELQITNTDILAKNESDRLKTLKEIDKQIEETAKGVAVTTGTSSFGGAVTTMVVDTEALKEQESIRSELISGLSEEERGVYQIQEAYNLLKDDERQYYAQLFTDQAKSTQELRQLIVEWDSLRRSVNSGVKGEPDSVESDVYSVFTKRLETEQKILESAKKAGREAGAAMMDAFNAQVDSMEIYELPVPDIKKIIDPSIDEIKTEFTELSNELNSMLSGMTSDAITNLVSGLFEGVASGDMESFFDNILESFAGFFIQMGSMLIAYGTAMAAFKNAFLQPWAAIGAGIALVAIGGAMKGAHSNFSSGAGTTSGSVGGGSTVPLDSGESLVIFEIEGDTLRGVLNNNSRKTNTYR